MKKIFLLCAIVITVALLTNYFIPDNFYRRNAADNGSANATANFNFASPQLSNKKDPAPTRAAEVAREPSSPSKAMIFLKTESKKIGAIDSDPAATELRLIEFARLMNASDLTILKKVALQVDVPGDERFLSAYLISKSNSAHAIAEMMAIAREPVPSAVSRDSRMYDQEVMIRAQAIEGLAHLKDQNRARQLLREYLDREGNVSLADHARRLLQELDRDND